jgi:capsular exopolysaccharide synthesis family protein
MSRIQQILDKAERDGAVRRASVAPKHEAPPEPADVEPARAPVAVRDAPAPAMHVPPPAAPARRGRVISAGRLSPLLVAALSPNALVAEQYRTLRTRLAGADHGQARRVLLVTSPAHGDGKSVTTANLGLTMAQEFNRRIAVVDADLRKPGLHALFGLPAAPGLTEVLAGEVTLDEALVHLPEYRLTVLPAGRPAEHPAELLGSQAMRRVVDALRGRFDRVVLDTPPALPLADVAVVAPLTDGVVVVVRAGVTPKPAVERTLASFGDERLLGLVLNGSQAPDLAAGYTTRAVSSTE